MTDKEAIEKLKNITKCDTERSHCEADAVLCELLTSLGYDNVVEIYLDIDKWYV